MSNAATFAATFAVFVLFIASGFNTYFTMAPNYCFLELCHPYYEALPVFRSWLPHLTSYHQISQHYKLFRVRDITKPNKVAARGHLSGLPVLFVHGHQGDFNQSASFAKYARFFRDHTSDESNVRWTSYSHHSNAALRF